MNIRVPISNCPILTAFVIHSPEWMAIMKAAIERLFL